MAVGDIYICPLCGDSFTKVIEDEEARKEFEINFPGANWNERVPICDDCYKETVIPDLYGKDTKH